MRRFPAPPAGPASAMIAPGARPAQGVHETLAPETPRYHVMTLPLMPKATAVWLIEKTALTFTQIADFCGMHPLEVQAIADGEVAQGIVGYDPIANGQLTAEEIRRCEADPARGCNWRRAPSRRRRS